MTRLPRRASGLALACCLVLVAGCEPEPAPPLNLVLITLDTTRADALGAYGQKLPVTPNLDRLAEDGVVFEQHVAAAPHTLASHASLFTGLNPPAHGVRSNLGYQLAAQNLTLAEQLREHGYATGAEIASTVMRRRTQIAQGFETIGDTDTPGVEFEVAEGAAAHELDLVRTGADVTRGGVSFLRAHRDEPFFLWLHYFDPHSPYAPPHALLRRFPGEPYLAEVAATDQQVGAVLAELAALGLGERTLIVVTSDHGEGLGEHGEATHSYFVYDSTMRVPLILAGPEALPAGRRVAALTRSVDVAPTVLDLLGLPPLPDADGTTLRPLIEGTQADLDLLAYGESFDLYHVLGTTPLRLLREGRWKYIHKVNPELYDVATDPGETRNLASERPELAARLRGELEALLSGLAPGPEGTSLMLDPASEAQLRALGYAAPADLDALPDELSLLAETGSDPAAHADDLAQIALVHGDLQAARHASALERLADLAAHHPDSAHLARLTGEALFGLERFAESITAFERSVALAPGDGANLRGLVRALESVGRTDAALARLAEFAERHPCSQVRGQLARRLHALGRDAEQARVLAEGVRACPEDAGLLNDHAWLLATSRDENVRDGEQAVASALQLIEALSGTEGPNELDTLAAAHAEAGDFAAAQAAAARAIEQLLARGASPKTLAAYRERLAQLERGEPVRD